MENLESIKISQLFKFCFWKLVPAFMLALSAWMFIYGFVVGLLKALFSSRTIF